MSYAKYTHQSGMTGKLEFDFGETLDPFTWEINIKSFNPKLFWGSIPEGLLYSQLDPKTKVGWRGPAIDRRDAVHLPSHFVHYGTWWDDYMPFRTQDFLKVERIKSD